MLVYFSSTSDMTARFVQKTELPSLRIPLRWKEDNPLVIQEPFLLVMPSYGAGRATDCVPKQVKKFLNIETNRSLLQGVIGSGNLNYGDKYCLGAKIVADKCKVPLMYTYELLGLPEDVDAVKDLYNEWQLKQQKHQ